MEKSSKCSKPPTSYEYLNANITKHVFASPYEYELYETLRGYLRMNEVVIYIACISVYISRTFQNKKIQKAPTRPSQSKSSCWISTSIPEILQVSAAQSSWERMLKQQHGNAAANLRRKTAPHFRKKKVRWLLHSHTNLPTYFGKRISKHGVRQKT